MHRNRNSRIEKEVLRVYSIVDLQSCDDVEQRAHAICIFQRIICTKLLTLSIITKAFRCFIFCYSFSTAHVANSNSHFNSKKKAVNGDY